MWSGLLSIGRTARRTWAMDAIDVARTAANAGVAGTATTIDGVGLTRRAIDLARTADDPALLLETLTIGSLHLAAVGSLPDVLRVLNVEARAIAESLDDRWSTAMVTGLDGMATYVAGELDVSMAQLRTAIDALRQLGDDGTACLLEVSYSEVAELRGDIAGATDAMAEALTLGSAAGFRSATVLRAVLCWLTGRNSEIERALELGREVVTLARQPFNPVIRGQALFALGVAETLAGLLDEAEEHLGEALQIHQQVGMIRETAMDHRHIGQLLHLRGQYAPASTHHARAVKLAVDVGLPWTVMLAARSMAATIVDDDPALACRLLGNTEAVSELFGYWPTPEERVLVDTTLANATERLGNAAVRKAQAAGAAVSYLDLPTLLPT
jgi:tetratricopeptide (TPR) repeat protein